MGPGSYGWQGFVSNLGKSQNGCVSLWIAFRSQTLSMAGKALSHLSHLSHVSHLPQSFPFGFEAHQNRTPSSKDTTVSHPPVWASCSTPKVFQPVRALLLLRVRMRSCKLTGGPTSNRHFGKILSIWRTTIFWIPGHMLQSPS